MLNQKWLILFELSITSKCFI